MSTDFFATLPVHRRFEALADDAAYTPVPDDWWVCTADIEGSTAMVEAGRYKIVNTIGAAVVAAQMNARGEGAPEFPFTFGGDGAALAVAPHWSHEAREALAATRRWALDAYGVTLRAAMRTVGELRADGHDVRIARYVAHAAETDIDAESAEVSYAMFEGGGLGALEAAMKTGLHTVEIAAPGTTPDLTGLSCRWSPVASENGQIVSLIVVPVPGTQREAVSRIYTRVNSIASGLARGGRPLGDEGPRLSALPANIAIELRNHRPNRVPRAIRAGGIALEQLFGWALQASGRTAGRFDPRRYSRVVARNSDYRKISDRLMMTIDCDRATLGRLRRLLDRARRDGIVTYGLSEQDEAIVTCIVPSRVRDDHIHFVDGAAGGYTAAARNMETSR